MTMLEVQATAIARASSSVGAEGDGDRMGMGGLEEASVICERK
jgi:hypothetical protein